MNKVITVVTATAAGQYIQQFNFSCVNPLTLQEYILGLYRKHMKAQHLGEPGMYL